MSVLRVWPADCGLRGRLQPPGDKSISHRLALLGAIAEGTTRIRRFLDSADTRATLSAVAALGARVEEDDQEIRIVGGRLKAPDAPLDLANSGTGMRLLCGLLAGRRELIGSTIELIGDHSLSARPMGRVIEPLAAMGARIQSRDGHAPMCIEPTALVGRRHVLPVASAQVKSAVLLAGLAATGQTVVIEPAKSRDHTERLLGLFGARLDDDQPGLAVTGGQRLRGADAEVPGDLSSAAFAIAAALHVADSRVVVERVGLNPTRDGVLRIIEAMGADVDVQIAADLGEEPVGRIVAAHGPLRAVDVPSDWVALAIDEFPIVMALAARAEGTTVIRGAGELRVKESDRLAVMCRALNALGVAVEENQDGARITGGPVRAGRVDCAGDHRIAMSLAVLALGAEGPLEIEQAEWIGTSYPGFVDDLRALGGRLEWIEDNAAARRIEARHE